MDEVTFFIQKVKLLTQWTKSPKKNSLKESIFINWALKIQYHIVKNTLLQTKVCVTF